MNYRQNAGVMVAHSERVWGKRRQHWQHNSSLQKITLSQAAKWRHLSRRACSILAGCMALIQAFCWHCHTLLLRKSFCNLKISCHVQRKWLRRLRGKLDLSAEVNTSLGCDAIALVSASWRLYSPSLPCAVLPALPAVPVLLGNLWPLVSLMVFLIHGYIPVLTWLIKISCAAQTAQWIMKRWAASLWITHINCTSLRCMVSRWIMEELLTVNSVQWFHER